MHGKAEKVVCKISLLLSAGQNKKSLAGVFPMLFWIIFLLDPAAIEAM